MPKRHSTGFGLTENSGEIWKDVIGYEGYYEVSSLGRIKSKTRRVPMSDGRMYRITGKVLKCQELGKYMAVCLSKSGKEELKTIHRLVLLAFVGERKDKPQCRHMNGKSHDNRLENLRWGTVQDNADDRARHGTDERSCCAGEKHWNNKLTNEQVRDIRKRLAIGENNCSIARKHNVTDACVRAIKTGKSWKYLK